MRSIGDMAPQSDAEPIKCVTCMRCKRLKDESLDFAGVNA